MTPSSEGNDRVTFLLIYVTFFLDNMLLTVVVPMMWWWIHPAAAVDSPHSPHFAPYNHTYPVTSGRYSAAAGVVLGSKAAVQLASCVPAARAVRAAGPRAALRAAIALLAAAALVFSWCSAGGGAWSALAGRVLHGGGAALSSVAGLVLAARRPRSLPTLLSSVALGSVAGYTCGGAAGEVGGRRAPFLLLAVALLTDLALQYKYLDINEDTEECPHCEVATSPAAPPRRWSCGARAAAAAVLVSTSVVATLEPCLPQWLHEHVHTQSAWWSVVFVCDSAGYLAGTAALGARGLHSAAAIAATAAAGLATVAAAAALIPTATQLWIVCVLQTALGLGIGATDAALFPAIIAPNQQNSDPAGDKKQMPSDGLQANDEKKLEDGRTLSRDKICSAHECSSVHAGDAAAAERAALLHAAASAAYAIGPVLGGLAAWGSSVGAALRALAAANLAAAVAVAATQLEVTPPQERTRLVSTTTR